MRGHVMALNDMRAKAMEMGGPNGDERQHSRNKLTACERVELLFDDSARIEEATGSMFAPTGDLFKQEVIMVQVIRDQISPHVAEGWAFIDDVIDPADTRAVIARGLEQTVEKHTERPWRRHGILPV